MTGERIPEAWTGKKVTILLQGSSESATEGITGVLQEVNDRGVAVSFTPMSRPTHQLSSRLLFYPWSVIRIIRFVEEEQDT